MKNSSDDGSSVPFVLNDPTNQISRECFANNGLARREFFSLLIGGLGTTALVGNQSIGPSSTIETNMEEVQFGISPVIDLAVAGASAGKTFNEFQAFIEGSLNAGIHVLCVPMAEIDNFEATARNIIMLYGRIAQIQGKALIIRKPSDIKKSILEKKVGIIPTFRGMEMIVEKLDLLGAFRAVGIGVISLTTPWKNWNGDGCYERSDLGLTVLGRMAVRTLEKERIVLDLSGVGRRSSLEAMELTNAPVLFSRSNSAMVREHPWNLTDTQIDACAKTDGVICLTALPHLVSESTGSLNDFVKHIDYVAARVGVRHVGIGLELNTKPLRRFSTDPSSNNPNSYLKGLDKLSHVVDLQVALQRRGYENIEIDGILGGNVLRVFQMVWRVENEFE